MYIISFIINNCVKVLILITINYICVNSILKFMLYNL